jgi:hypothetical protein
MSFFQTKKKEKLWKGASLREYAQKRANPGCGWYQIHSFALDEEPDLEQLKWCISDTDSLALVVFSIGAYKERALDEYALTRMRKVLGFFSSAGKDVIVRIVYDTEGKGMEHEPDFSSEVAAHIRQLAPVLQEAGDIVRIWQGVLIGSWGEMHGSKFLTDRYLNVLMREAEAASAKETYLAVRRPDFWRSFHPGQEPSEYTGRWGLYDDAILGSDTDLGTFAEGEEAQELLFEQQLCTHVPHGGELLYPQGQMPTLPEIMARLGIMHISYLNRIHDPKMIEYLKNVYWKEPDEWQGESGYDYIGAHLGCRFCIRSVQFIREKKQKGRLEIVIKNIGFASGYESIGLYLQICHFEDLAEEIELPVDLKELESGTCMSIVVPLEKTDGKLSLQARRLRDGKPYFFANKTEEDASVVLGYFQ